MPVLAWAVVATCAAFLTGLAALLGWRDVQWWLRQHRRRPVAELMVDLTRRVRP